MGCKYNHTHLSMSKYTYKDCEKLIDDIINLRVPRDPYLRVSATRLTRNDKYVINIEIKTEKDKNKPKYINKPSYIY